MTRIVGSVDSRGRPRYQTVNDDPSETVQSDARLADIQEILKPYGPIGLNQYLDNVDDLFLDVSEFTDYADLKRQTSVATETFMKLPPQVREAFRNDVYEWLDAAHDKEKRNAVLEKLGMVPAQPASPAVGSADAAPQPPSESSE